MNILAACTYYNVNLTKLEKELYDKLANDYGFDDDIETYLISEEDMYYYEIPFESIDTNYSEFDEDMLETLLEDILGIYPYYLVFASGCRWNGANGYKIVDDIKEVAYRNYEISLEFIDKGKRKAEFRESSHDVPTGSTTYVIGISLKEYDMLSEAEFEEVEDFINKTE